jgi:hypothetical protein
MEIDFKKLSDDYLEKFNEKNPNPDNDPGLMFNSNIVRIASEVCVSILKEYEQLKSSKDL